MGLKDLMGESYKEDLTVSDIETFFNENAKIVNLSTGKYVDKGKLDEANSKYKTLAENTKDYEELKNKYNELNEKVNKDNQMNIVKKYAKNEFVDYVYFQMKQKNVEPQNLEESVKKYCEENKQYSNIVEENQPVNRIFSSINLSGEQPKQTGNDAINQQIRESFGYGK